MNLLALTGALLTASASVTTGSLKMENHHNKMMDVTYKYQSNEVDDVSDLVIGNIYHIHFDSSNFLSFDQGDYIDFKVVKINSIDFSRISVEAVDTYDEISDLYGFLGYLSINSSEIYVSLPYSFETDGLISALYSLDDSYSLDAYAVLDGFVLGHGDDTYFNGKPISFTDYNEIVPSNEHRGNLYTTIYDFFYGVFDTSDTNELSMTIMGQEMNLTSWLAHTVTIVLLLLGVLWLILVIRWMFRVFSGLVKI